MNWMMKLTSSAFFMSSVWKFVMRKLRE